jgi:hypothetical protein
MDCTEEACNFLRVALTASRSLRIQPGLAAALKSVAQTPRREVAQACPIWFGLDLLVFSGSGS